MSNLTPTQARYLSFIKSYMGGFQVAPAESEIAEALEVAPPSVNRMIRSLEEKGFISREKGVARSIRIIVPLDSIPDWKGKTITRTVYQWGRTSQPKVNSPSVSHGHIYHFKITLADTHPSIWREFETGDVTLCELHEQIQIVMGWTNSHLHQFRIGDEFYTDGRLIDGDDFALDYKGMRISDLVTAHGQKLKFHYEYDFGDSWDHEVVLKRILTVDPKKSYPACTAGAGACPPEDVGGTPGFYNYLEAMSDPSHPEHEDYLENYGPFDPSKFDHQKTTTRMRQRLRMR